ncbi:MAG: hypothetical protein JO100_04145 [Pseudonocardia sp.]|nr:hypothetical protein [Pseudonocardia sp.]
MTLDEFDALFDSFRCSVVRLETLAEYNVGGAEAERLRARRERRPRPERSLRTDPWLARIAVSTVNDGKSWERVRVVDNPLTDYQSGQLESYKESQACGEQIRIAYRSDVGPDLGPDVWLFDAGEPDEHAAVMHYTPDGRFLGADLIMDIGQFSVAIARVRAHARPLNEFLATMTSA